MEANTCLNFGSPIKTTASLFLFSVALQFARPVLRALPKNEHHVSLEQNLTAISNRAKKSRHQHFGTGFTKVILWPLTGYMNETRRSTTAPEAYISCNLSPFFFVRI